MPDVIKILGEVAAILSAIAAIYAARGSNKNAERIEDVKQKVGSENER